MALTLEQMAAKPKGLSLEQMAAGPRKAPPEAPSFRPAIADPADVGPVPQTPPVDFKQDIKNLITRGPGNLLDVVIGIGEGLARAPQRAGELMTKLEHPKMSDERIRQIFESTAEIPEANKGKVAKIFLKVARSPDALADVLENIRKKRQAKRGTIEFRESPLAKVSEVAASGVGSMAVAVGVGLLFGPQAAIATLATSEFGGAATEQTEAGASILKMGTIGTLSGTAEVIGEMLVLPKILKGFDEGIAFRQVVNIILENAGQEGVTGFAQTFLSVFGVETTNGKTPQEAARSALTAGLKAIPENAWAGAAGGGAAVGVTRLAGLIKGARRQKVAEAAIAQVLEATPEAGKPIAVPPERPLTQLREAELAITPPSQPTTTPIITPTPPTAVKPPITKAEPKAAPQAVQVAVERVPKNAVQKLAKDILSGKNAPDSPEIDALFDEVQTGLKEWQETGDPTRYNIAQAKADEFSKTLDLGGLQQEIGPKELPEAVQEPTFGQTARVAISEQFTPESIEVRKKWQVEQIRKGKDVDMRNAPPLVPIDAVKEPTEGKVEGTLATPENLKALGAKLTGQSGVSESQYYNLNGIKVRLSEHWGASKDLQLLHQGNYGDLLQQLADVGKMPMGTKQQRREQFARRMEVKNAIKRRSQKIWSERLAAHKKALTQPPTPEITPSIGDFLDGLEDPSQKITKDLLGQPLRETKGGVAGKQFEAFDKERFKLAEPDLPGQQTFPAKPTKGRDFTRPKSSGFVSLPFKLPGPAQLREGLESAYQKYINRFASIENATKKAQALGMEILPGENPGLRARSYLGLGRKVESMLEHQTFRITPEGDVEVTGEGLKPILDDFDKSAKKIEKKRDKREKDLNDYLIAQRTVLDLQRTAFEGAKQNIASPRQVSAAKSTLANLAKKYGENISILRDSAERLYEYQKRVLHLLVDAGNLSQKQFDQIVALNQHYIPFDRVIEDFGGVPVQKGRFTKARAPISRIKGSELAVQNPIESIIKNTYAIVDRAERNTVALNLANLTKVLEDNIRPVKTKMVPIRLTEAEGDKVIFRPSAFAPRGNVIEYFDKGKRKFIEVTPNLFNAMTGLNEAGSSLLVKIFAKPAHWLRVGATITPEFMVRNIIRDQFTALMQTSHGFIPFLDSVGAIADVLGKTDVYHEWLRVGGAYAGFVELNRPALQKALKELRGRQSLLRKLNVISRAQDLSQLFEQATRVAVFKSARAAGKPGIEAGFISRESTIDFARKGSSMRDVNQVLAFFNAGIQGLDKTIRNSIKHPYATAIKGMAAITIPSLLLYLRNRDEDDWDQIPRWQRDLFWLVKIRGNWWRIPKPFLYGQIFGSIPERFFEYLDTKDKKAFDEFGRSVFDSVSPVSGDPVSGLLMTAVKPIIENAVNHNFFLDRPIVSQAQARLRPSQQFNRYTSESAKQLGVWFNYSPAKIENLIRGWFGGTGRYGLEASDMLAKAISREAKGERPREFSDFPLVKGFAVRRPLSQPADINRFYEQRKELTENTATWREFAKSNKPQEAKRLRTAHPEIRVSKNIEKVTDNLGKLRKRIIAIEDSSKPDAEKRRLIDIIEKQRLELAQKGLEIIEKGKK